MLTSWTRGFWAQTGSLTNAAGSHPGSAALPSDNLAVLTYKADSTYFLQWRLRVSVNNLIPTAGMCRKTVTIGIAAAASASRRDICWKELGGVEISSFQSLKTGQNKTLQHVEEWRVSTSEERASMWPDAKDYTLTWDGTIPVLNNTLAPHMWLEVTSWSPWHATYADVYAAGSACYCTALSDWVSGQGCLYGQTTDSLVHVVWVRDGQSWETMNHAGTVQRWPPLAGPIAQKKEMGTLLPLSHHLTSQLHAEAEDTFKEGRDWGKKSQDPVNSYISFFCVFPFQHSGQLEGLLCPWKESSHLSRQHNREKILGAWKVGLLLKLVLFSASFRENWTAAFPLAQLGFLP